jgi:hypothetical protein
MECARVVYRTSFVGGTSQGWLWRAGFFFCLPVLVGGSDTEAQEERVVKKLEDEREIW